MLMSIKPYLYRLMARATLPFNVRVKPEELICIVIANNLRAATLDKRLIAIWSHIANEGKRNRIVGAVLKAMGLISGTPDYFFIWPTGGGVIEVKAGKGKLSPLQKDYSEWCAELGIKHAVCRSAEEVFDVLAGWGVLEVRNARLL